ncbi:hypothetical protein FMM08_20490 [Quadrisphaera setariae]|uniref:Uncharacterized protein n=1 Tax=Quadrisphaera setariae TaxID=2593304 RepID=A0A5C8Z5F5_9ACTN|nr:hypothetical protein FMM08_20490 [Quadrisphaera setariae]
MGALAGCVVAAVAATAQNPALGVAGLAAAGVPLTLSGLRARHRARLGRVRGRHVAGLEQVCSTAPSDGAVPFDVRLDPAVDVEEPSPAAFRALALAPVAPAAAADDDTCSAADAEVVDVVRAAEREEATVLQLPMIIPSQRAEHALERDADAAVPAASAAEARPEVVVHVAASTGEVAVHVGPPASEVAPEQRALEIAQLKRLWAVGTGPDTGSLRAAAPAA